MDNNKKKKIGFWISIASVVAVTILCLLVAFYRNTKETAMEENSREQILTQLQAAGFDVDQLILQANGQPLVLEKDGYTIYVLPQDGVSEGAVVEGQTSTLADNQEGGEIPIRIYDGNLEYKQGDNWIIAGSVEQYQEADMIARATEEKNQFEKILQAKKRIAMGLSVPEEMIPEGMTREELEEKANSLSVVSVGEAMAQADIVTGGVSLQIYSGKNGKATKNAVGNKNTATSNGVEAQAAGNATTQPTTPQKKNPTQQTAVATPEWNDNGGGNSGGNHNAGGAVVTPPTPTPDPTPSTPEPPPAPEPPAPEPTPDPEPSGGDGEDASWSDDVL